MSREMANIALGVVVEGGEAVEEGLLHLISVIDLTDEGMVLVEDGRDPELDSSGWCRQVLGLLGELGLLGGNTHRVVLGWLWLGLVSGLVWSGSGELWWVFFHRA